MYVADSMVHWALMQKKRKLGDTKIQDRRDHRDDETLQVVLANRLWTVDRKHYQLRG